MLKKKEFPFAPSPAGAFSQLVLRAFSPTLRPYPADSPWEREASLWVALDAPSFTAYARNMLEKPFPPTSSLVAVTVFLILARRCVLQR